MPHAGEPRHRRVARRPPRRRPQPARALPGRPARGRQSRPRSKLFARSVAWPRLTASASLRASAANASSARAAVDTSPTPGTLGPAPRRVAPSQRASAAIGASATISTARPRPARSNVTGHRPVRSYNAGSGEDGRSCWSSVNASVGRSCARAGKPVMTGTSGKVPPKSGSSTRWWALEADGAAVG